MDNDSELTFITYDGPKKPQDASTRSLIRRRCMRDAAAERKQQGYHGRYTNRRQYPIFIGMPNTPAVTANDHSLLLSLAPLTGLRLGVAICTNDVLWSPRIGSTKVFSFIPSRYGHVPALTCATDCVVAKRRTMLTGRIEGEALVLERYSKALRALQAALDDESQRCSPETLCAAQLLGVFEVRLSCPLFFSILTPGIYNC